MRFFTSLLTLYQPRFAALVVSLLQISDYHPGHFLRHFWGAEEFAQIEIQPDAERLAARNQALRLIIILGSLAQLAGGAILLGLGLSGSVVGGIFFGIALIISYPIVWAHLVLFAVIVIRLPGLPKKLGKQLVLAILTSQVKALRKKYDFKIIAVAGSAGKTSTKFAIARVLTSKLKVRWQQGNYNDIVSVPLVIFGQPMPGITKAVAWIKIFSANNKVIKSGYDIDVVVLELGSDGPGQIAHFSRYLKADIGVVTAVAPEHMEFFGSMENVASEELSLSGFSDALLINSDLIANKYTKGLKKSETYGFSKADWQLSGVKFSGTRYNFSLKHRGKAFIKASAPLLGQNQLYGAAAATAVASELGLNITEIKAGLGKLEPVNGRLKSLKGIKNSTILDDSYNSAPEAAIAALETLYKIKAPQKIALLGSMNELGNYSPEAHRLVGEACDPKKLDLVITIGDSAKNWLAPAANGRGCKVKSFADPVSAGKFAKKQIKSKALILAKGSQNGVFAEEAIKLLLKNKADEDQLVRQSPAWLATKRKQFKL